MEVRQLQTFCVLAEELNFTRTAERVFTVDSFQGRQAALVAVSLVRNNASKTRSSAIGFVGNKARATVMFSRAERLLVVVGCSKHFKAFRRRSDEQNYITDIYDFIEQHGEVVQAYDFLRREDTEAMQAFHAKSHR